MTDAACPIFVVSERRSSETVLLGQRIFAASDTEAARHSIVDFTSLPPKERVTAACDFFSGLFFIRLPPRDAPDFVCRTEFWRFGDCVATKGSRHGGIYRSPPGYLTDAFLSARLMLEGRSVNIRDGNAETFDPRALTFGRYLADATSVAPGPTRFYGLAAPADLVAPAREALPRDRKIGRDTPDGRVLHSLMVSIFHKLERGEADAAAALSDTVISLFRLLSLGFAKADEKAQAVYLAAQAPAIRHYINRHLGDLDLGPEKLARAFGLSRAGLYRALVDEGGVAEAITRRRMARAFAQLATAVPARGLVKNVAYATGYDDPAHFMRVFRRHLGVRPGDVMGLELGYGEERPDEPAARSTRTASGIAAVYR